MKFAAFATASLLANVVLGGWCLKTVWLAPSRGVSPLESGSTPLEVSSIGSSGTGQAIAEATKGSRWKDLQSRDLAEMVRHLRNAGCPEETIQDLILAEVNRDFAKKTRALFEPFLNTPYWRTSRPYDANSQERREAAKKQREVQKEKSDRLVELLGVDPEKQRRKEDGLPEGGYFSFIASRVEFLPESRREAVAGYLEQFEEKMQDFYRDTRGLWDSETRAEQRRLETERLQGLGQFLTPEEVREYDLRNSQLANQLSHDLQSLSLTRQQYETLFDLRKKYGETIYNYADTVPSSTTTDQVQQNKKALSAEIAEALGADFAKEYARSQDYSFQQLARLAKRNDLPAGTASTIFDLKENLEQNVRALRDDPAFDTDQRQRALEEIRSQTEETIKNALGETVYQKYLSTGGSWLRNLAPMPPPKR